jgi:hypothetical protein
MGMKLDFFAPKVDGVEAEFEVVDPPFWRSG